MDGGNTMVERVYRVAFAFCGVEMVVLAGGAAEPMAANARKGASHAG